MKWILERDVSDTERIATVLKAKGIEFLELKHYVFSTGKEMQDHYPGRQNVFVSGSIGFCQKASRLLWHPGPYFSIEKYDCCYYYPRFGARLLNSDYTMLPFGEMTRLKDTLYNHFAVDNCIFVRPSSCKKQFTGQTIHSSEWESKLKLLGWYDVRPEELVVVSSPKKILSEIRVVMHGNQPVTSSQYSSWEERYVEKKDRTKCFDNDETFFAWVRNTMCGVDYSPDPVWVLDVALTSDGWFVLEVGSVSCAGLYGCDIEKIVEAIEASNSFDSEIN